MCCTAHHANRRWCPPRVQVLDVPLLFETGMAKMTRPHTVVVHCSPELQVRPTPVAPAPGTTGCVHVFPRSVWA